MIKNVNKTIHTIFEPYKPKILARINDYDLRISMLEGEFPLHKHDDTDELFVVQQGYFIMEHEGKMIKLNEGDVYVVPKGEYHRPIAKERCFIPLFEPSKTINTGNLQESHYTLKNLEEI